MTDKELLELAAKAEYGNYFGNQMLEAGWNPLTEDSDALRLVVMLCLCVTVTKFGDVHAEGPLENAGLGVAYAYEHLGDDPYAATRRAIVRAAAEIGKNIG